MTARSMFEPGDRIGPYEIQGRLRAGGMATLFLGRRHGAAGVSRLVVIKVIHAHLAEDELITRMFIDEARISSKISHSNVVYVEQFGEHEGVYFMVMEYVEGCSLEQLQKALIKNDQRIAAAVAVHLVLETAAGLHAAHETCDEDGRLLGIVHRDVSPSNILIGRDGRIKVIDFGIAKAHGRLGETRSGAGLKGKVRYMSPEQAWGMTVDRRSDVYALGVVLWELLTRKGLFRGNDELAVLELVRNPKIPPPSQVQPTVPPELDAVVARATARLPEDRYATVAELREELLRAVPDARTVADERVAELVAMVRETFPPPATESGPRLITPRPISSPRLPSSSTTEVDTQVSPVPASSVRTANGELRTSPPPARSRGLWLALGGLAVAGGIASGIVVPSLRSSTRDEPIESHTSAVAPALLAPPDAAPASAAAPADAAMTVSPALATATGSAATKPPVVSTTKPHTHTGKRPNAKLVKPASVEAVEADGAVLADEPGSQDSKPAQKSKDSVKADDAVLSK
ncbi:MAG TPA: serine/threonine-protein kinase [Kofleriaceae bacterium]|nr:serine/threonine-protein kinase [Kofleriaceae bacterium]